MTDAAHRISDARKLWAIAMGRKAAEAKALESLHSNAVALPSQQEPAIE